MKKKENIPRQKLIYILNHYSHKSDSHFYHVLNLLEKMADIGVDIALIIEKSDDIPAFNHSNIQVFPIQSVKINRIKKLFILLLKLNKKGFKPIFIRITWVAAVISILTGYITGQKTFFWKSGQGIIEEFRSLNWGFRKIKYWLKHILPFWFIKNFTYKLVTGPEFMASYYTSQRHVSPEKILILYNDIDLKRFHRVSEQEKINLRNDLDFPLDKQIILFVHHLSPIRKTSYYLPYILTEFFRDVSDKDVLFVIAGGGPEKARIEAEINANGLSGVVRMMDSIPNAEIDRLFKCADLFIQPSYAEGFPRTLIEAMACGLPVVCTNAGGIVDILGKDQLKLMVDVSDRKRFAENMILLSRDRALAQKLSKENQITAKRFSTERIAKMYVDKLFDPSL